MARILVTGAGGFIGHHLAKRLKAEGHWVRGADVKRPEFEPTAADEFVVADLRDYANCVGVCGGIDEVYNLAADMGGIGYITAHLADIARNNILINVNMLEAARVREVKKYLYTSSACVYAHDKQVDENVTPLKEEDAYPAMPEPGYGWEKLFSEEMCKYYQKDYGMDIKIVRFHNVYGPLGTYDGGKEKSPAALCRKIAKAKDGGSIEIWGDGHQTRSYMYIDDCVEGLIRLMASSYNKPLNLGTEELISINGLAEKITHLSGKSLSRTHNLSAPQGVRGRNSDNTRLRGVLGWEPKITLDQGLLPTYEWIKGQAERDAIAEKWEADGAEHTLRVTFPITSDSLVYDVGGYRGEWASEIIAKYDPEIRIFEPIRGFVDVLNIRFADNPKVKVFHHGLLDRSHDTKITKQESASSLYLPDKDSDREAVYMKDIAQLPFPDLISINAEGAEYPLLRRMIDSGWAVGCKFIQIQFHEFYPNAKQLRDQIRKDLSKTHEEIYCYPFIWEAWAKK